MQFEVIRKSHKKEILIGVIVFVIIAIVFIVHQSFAKYQTTKNMKIAEGTINYKVPDFNVIAMYKNDGAGDVEIITMPESGYTVNESKSYCNVNNTKDTNAKIFTNEEGQHVISEITKGSKCYIFFDKETSTILKNMKVNLGKPDFSKTSCTSGCGENTVGVYTTQDDDGYSYYFRGDVTNNYVKFANKYWRIIRINGDGSIRLIYDGTSIHNNGTSTSDSIAVASQKFSHKDAYYNSATDNAYVQDNMYVGFKYTSGQVHGTETKSNVLTQLETWYTNNLSSYASKLDTNAGFCGDRTPYTNTSGTASGGTGTISTYYGAYIRLKTNKAPSLTCPTEDFYTVSGVSEGNKSLTYPIGLITADEVAMAGGVDGTASPNKSYYLYNGQEYWTMSPYYYSGVAVMFRVGLSGYLGCTEVHSVQSVRPVINLRSDVPLTGSGTASDPYVVQ